MEREAVYFRFPVISALVTILSFSAVTETSAYALNPLMPEDMKQLTAFPHKANRSFMLFN